MSVRTGCFVGGEGGCEDWACCLESGLRAWPFIRDGAGCHVRVSAPHKGKGWARRVWGSATLCLHGTHARTELPDLERGQQPRFKNVGLRVDVAGVLDDEPFVDAGHVEQAIGVGNKGHPPVL